LATHHAQGWSIFLPAIADQPGAEIADMLGGGLGREDSEPALILLDAKRALVETVGRARRRAKVIAWPLMIGYVRPRSPGYKHAGSGQKGAYLHEIATSHAVVILLQCCLWGLYS